MTKARNLADNALTTVSPTELGFLDGVTSAVQTQLNSKIGQSTAINPSTITAKGDLIVGTGAGTFVAQGVGTNGQLLSANSAQADGVEWVNPPSSGGITLLSTTALSTTTTTVSGISGDYKDLIVEVQGASQASSASQLNMRVNGISGANTYRALFSTNYSNTWTSPSAAQQFDIQVSQGASGNNNIAQVIFQDYARASTSKSWRGWYMQGTGDVGGIFFGSCPSANSAITSITIFGGATFTAGTIRIYGVK